MDKNLPPKGVEGPGAHEPGQLPSVTPVGCALAARLRGHPRARHHPADVVFFGQITREPSATRAGCSVCQCCAR